MRDRVDALLHGRRCRFELDRMLLRIVGDPPHLWVPRTSARAPAADRLFVETPERPSDDADPRTIPLRKWPPLGGVVHRRLARLCLRHARRWRASSRLTSFRTVRTVAAWGSSNVKAPNRRATSCRLCSLKLNRAARRSSRATGVQLLPWSRYRASRVPGKSRSLRWPAPVKGCGARTAPVLCDDCVTNGAARRGRAA